MSADNTEVVQLCVNRLLWGGLDVAVLPVVGQVNRETRLPFARLKFWPQKCAHVWTRTSSSELKRGHPQNKRGVRIPVPSQDLSGLRLPAPVQWLSNQQQQPPPHHHQHSSPKCDGASSPTSSMPGAPPDLHTWLAGRSPCTVLAVSGPSSNTVLLAEAAAHPSHCTTWSVGPSAPAGPRPLNPAHPPSTLPCLSYLPQRIAHLQLSVHMHHFRQGSLGPGYQDLSYTRELPGFPNCAVRSTQPHAELPPPPPPLLLVVGHVMKASREQAMAKCTPPPAQHGAAGGADARGGEVCSSACAGLLSLVPCGSDSWGLPARPYAAHPLPSPGSTLWVSTDPSKANVPRRRGCCLVFAPLDLSRPLEEQMPFHVSCTRVLTHSYIHMRTHAHTHTRPCPLHWQLCLLLSTHAHMHARAHTSLQGLHHA